MSKGIRSFLFIFLSVIITLTSITTGFSQNKYWVNGTGSWEDPNHWATVSGGKPGTAIPTKDDNVIFDNNSFTAANQTVVIKNKAICKDFSWNVENIKPILKSKSFLFKSITKAGLLVYGSIHINENINNQFFGDIIFKSELENSISINSEVNSNLVLNNKFGRWNVNTNIATKGDIQLISGNLDLNNKNIECNAFIGSGSESRFINLGNSEIKTNIWDFEDYTNLDFKADQFVVIVNGASEKNIKTGNIPTLVFKKGTKGVFKLEDIVSTPTTCYEKKNGSITVSVSGGTKPYTYTLKKKVGAVYVDTLIIPNVTDTLYNFINLRANFYRVKIDEMGGGSYTSSAVEVTRPAQLSAGTISVAQGLLCFDGSDAKLEANPTGGTIPYAYDWYKFNIGTGFYESIGQFTKIAIDLDQGLYQVRINDLNTCGPKSVDIFFTNPPNNIDIPDEIIFSNIESTNSCTGADNGTITLTASGGTGDIDYYLIRQSDLLVIPAGPPYDEDGIFTGLQPDTYETYAVDVNGCEKRGTDVTITSLINPTASIIPNDPTICPGATIAMDGNPSLSLDGSSFVSHVWTGDVANLSPTNIQSPTFTGASNGVFNLTYTVTDNNGCIGQDVVAITVGDTEDPVAICKNITVQLDGTGNVSITGLQVDNGSTDNCTSHANLIFNVAPNSFTCANIGVNNVTLTVIDELGNSDNCAATVTVQDNTNPSITCAIPAASYNADLNQCYYTVPGNGLNPTASSDNCGVASVLNNFNGTNTLNGAQFPVGNTTVIWTVTDVNGNTANCQYNIVVVDNQNPSITCAIPAASYNADLNQCYYTVPGNGLNPTASSDNCGVASVLNNFNGTNTLNGAQFPVGTTTVIWTITDVNGRTANCQYNIVVVDNQNPVITCAVPAASYNTDLNQCYYTVPNAGLNPTTSDNCGVATVVNNFTGTNTLLGAQFPTGTTTVIWTVTDVNGRTANCQYDIVVVDNQNPVITCAVPAASYNADLNQCYYTVPNASLNPTTSDNCGVATVVNNFTSTNTLLGAQFPTGTTTVIWTVTDVNGKTANCQYDIVVVDGQNPSITCAIPAASYNADLNQCYYTVPGNGLNPTASSDNCGVASVLNNFNGTNTLNGAQFPVGTTTVIWTITDVSGRTANCQYNIVVVDNQDPLITCAIPAASYNADLNQCYYTVPGNGLNPTASSDNCGVASVLNNFNGTNTLNGAQFPVGTTTVIWTITDVNGRTANCQYNVVVVDNQNPVITCAVPAASYNTDLNQCYYTVPNASLNPTTSDNCGVATVVNNFTGTNTLLGAQFPTGTTTVIWTVTDVNGRTANCQYDIVVVDNQNPVITCAVPAASYNTDLNQCYYTVPNASLNPTTSDNCGVATVVNNFTGTNTLLGAQFPTGTTTVIWTVTDVNGRTANCQYDIVVVDGQNPSITCAIPAASYNADLNQCYYTVPGNGLNPTASNDNCGVASVLNNFNGTNTLNGAQFPVGTTTVIWTVTDLNGRTANCQYNIVVVDNQDPLITCAIPAASYNADLNQCYYTVPDNGLNPTASSDNCGVASVLNNFNGTNTLNGAQFPVGTTTVIWTITDVNGRTSNCQYDIVVVDNQNPVITCAVPAASYNTDLNQCYYTVPNASLNPTTSDNCGVATVVNNFTGTNTLLGAQFPTGTTTVIWTVTDINGRTANCQYDIVVVDNQNPDITCPADVSVLEDGSCSAVVIGLATVTSDNCGVTLQTWSMVGATVGTSPGAGINDISGTAFNIGITTVTYHIEDAAGNIAECSFDVEVYDETYGGLIDANQSICYNTAPNPFTNEDPASVCGGFTYQWQMKSGTGLWSDIPGATNATYTEINPLTEVTYYNRKAISNLGFGTANSDTITVSIVPTAVAYAGEDVTLCYNTAYKIPDADSLDCSSISWSTFGGDGTFDNNGLIDPTYTPGASDLLNGFVKLVLTATGNFPCVDVTDTVVITYLPKLRASIGKPTPFYISDATTHIDVYVKLSNHNFMAYLGVYLIAPNDTEVELKPYCANPFPGNFSTSGTYRFYNDPLDTSAIVPISACAPVTGRYDFTGDWKVLDGLDPANGAWRIRLVDNRSLGDFDGLFEEATITFTDKNGLNVLESVLYADSSINMTINEYSGTGLYARTSYALPITGLTTSCFGLCDATAIVTASGGLPPYVLYEWSTSLDFSAPFSTNDTVDLCEGKYYVQVTDSHGCIAVDSVVVGSPPEIKIDDRYAKDVACNGGSTGEIMLKFSGGTGALQYTHDGGGTWFNSGDTIKNLSADTYLLTIRDLAGCTKDTSIIINESAAILISIDDIIPITCHDSKDGAITISASNGVAPYNYSIAKVPDFTNTTGVFTALDSGYVYIAVRDANSCIAYGDTIYLTNPDTITINSVITVPVTCLGLLSDGVITIDATGGVGTLFYSINGVDFQLDPTFTGLTEGTYSVYVKDDCYTKVSIGAAIVTGPPPIVLDPIDITDVNTCYGDNTGQINITATGGTGVFRYSINGGIDYFDAGLFTNLYSGSYIIKVIDDDICTSVDSTVFVGQPLEIVIDNRYIKNVACFGGTTGEIMLEFSGGTGALQYTHNGGTTWFNSGDTIKNLSPNTYLLSIEDANGCTRDTTIIINEPGSILAAFNVRNVSCNGFANGQLTVVPINGTSPYSFVWSNGGTTATITGLDVGTYYVTITDDNGCTVSDNSSITEPLVLTVSSDIKNKFCNSCDPRNLVKANGRINAGGMGGNSGFTYSWTGPGTYTASQDLIENLQPGIYSLRVTDSKGCIKDTSFTIIEDYSHEITDLQVDFDDLSVCWNDSVYFTSTYTGTVDSIFMQVIDLSTFISTNWVYRVDSENPFRGRHKIEAQSDFQYIRLANEYCKADTGHIIVDYFPDFNLNIEDYVDGNPFDDTLYIKGETFGYLNATVFDIANISYEWIPTIGLENPFAKSTKVEPDSSRWYTVVATSTDGCVDLSRIYVEFIPAITPNEAFSPNDDGINDYWRIKYIDKFKNNVVTVLNRWGSVVYTQKGYDNDDPSKRWDGRAKNGKKLPSGTYYYIIILNEPGFDAIKGPITIIR